MSPVSTTSSHIAKAQTQAQSANKPVAPLFCRDLMWEEVRRR